MHESETRQTLRQAQSDRAAAETTLTEARAALARAHERATLLDQEIARAEGEEVVDVRKLADALARGEDAAVGKPRKGKADLEFQREKFLAAIAVLEGDVAAAEAGVEASGAALNEAIKAVIGEHVGERLAHAVALRTELREMLPLLTVAYDAGYSSAELYQFVRRDENAVHWNDPGRKSANALLRAWRGALVDDAEAQISIEAGAALQKAEADAEAEDEARQAAEKAAGEAEARDRQAAYNRKRAQEEAQSWSRPVGPVEGDYFSRIG